MKFPRVASALLFAALAAPSTGVAASDEKAFADLKSQYEKLVKLHDDDGVRERRKLILKMFDFLDQAACRKLLRDAWEHEDSADTRIAVVQVLGADGDPKDIEFLVHGFAKEKQRGPVIALGEGLACTPKATAAAASSEAVTLLPKSKGDLRAALLEGIGELGDPGAFDALSSWNEKLTPVEHLLRNVALGACGKDKAVESLAKEAKAADPTVKLGAVLGLAKTGAEAALPSLVEALRDTDPRVVEAAADALGAAKHKPAAAALTDAMGVAPLRTRAAARAALVAILGKDYGDDGAAWRAVLDGKKPDPPTVAAEQPKRPSFFGIPVVSDRVVLVLDTGHTMQWMNRFQRAQDGLCDVIAALDDGAMFDVYTVGRVPERFEKTMTAGAAAKEQALAWVKKRLTTGGRDTEATLLAILKEQPDVDTILYATDRYPAGDSAFDSALDVVETFRAENLGRRVRLHVAYVVPGGRYVQAELKQEMFDDRGAVLKQLAETSGGKYVQVDK